MIRRRSCTWISLTRSRRSSLACSGLWLARISSSWSASPVSTAGSGAVCACVPRLWVRSASCSRSVARRAVGADAFLAELGREVAVFEGFEVALQLRFQPADVGAGGGELFFEAGPFGLGVACDVGERLFDEVAVAVEVGELGEDGCSGLRFSYFILGSFVRQRSRRPRSTRRPESISARDALSEGSHRWRRRPILVLRSARLNWWTRTSICFPRISGRATTRG